MTRWQIRSAYFKGAATYTFGTSEGEEIKVTADREGYFELAESPKGPLGVFAKRAPQDRMAW